MSLADPLSMSTNTRRILLEPACWKRNLFLRVKGGKFNHQYTATRGNIIQPIKTYYLLDQRSEENTNNRLGLRNFHPTNSRSTRTRTRPTSWFYRACHLPITIPNRDLLQQRHHNFLSQAGQATIQYSVASPFHGDGCNYLASCR
jgi:hypothetical protein